MGERLDTLLSPGHEGRASGGNEQSERPRPSTESAQSPWHPSERGDVSSHAHQNGESSQSEDRSGSDSCLTNDELLVFADGKMGLHELAVAYAHADGCPACQHLLAEAVHAVASEAMPDSRSREWNTTFFPTAVVARRYRILRFVARGGMGEVYEAHDCALGERVALKAVVSTACDSPRAVQYLRREVQLNHRVSHPNVCRIFDLNSHTLETTGAVVQFLTMEFVEGEPLGKRLRAGGPLPVTEAVRIGRELLSGLRAAHSAGILHRDFKSDNIMLRKSAKDAVLPVILDFGLARCLDGDARAPLSARNPGLVGTPSYMAPEQLEGRPLSAASDIYAFGVVWFEMLTGQLPFKVGAAPANAPDRLYQVAPVPSSINSAVPRSLDGVVLRCLSRRVEDRFQSADEVLAALDRARDFRPRRRRRTRLWGGLSCVASGLAAVLWLTQLRSTSSSPSRTIGHAGNLVASFASVTSAMDPPLLEASEKAQARADAPIPIPTVPTAAAAPTPATSTPPVPTILVPNGNRTPVGDDSRRP